MARGRPKIGANVEREKALKKQAKQRTKDKPQLLKVQKRERKGVRKPVPWWKKILRNLFPEAMADITVEGPAIDAVELLECT